MALAGRMGERALLVVDGRPHTLAVGQTAAGVRLLRWTGDSAEVERGGSTLHLRLGGAPAQLSAAAGAGAAAREIVITRRRLAGTSSAGGAINGRATRFMVDTGATMVSIGRDDAERLGLDLQGRAQRRSRRRPTAR